MQPHKASKMETKFNVGQIYSTRSIGDHDCIFNFSVVRRTEKTVWLQQLNMDGSERGDVQKFRVFIYNNREQVKPFGSYSMCPILDANDKNLLYSDEKKELMSEYSKLNDQVREYNEIKAEICSCFHGKDAQKRLSSLSQEYGIDFLLKRRGVVSKKLEKVA